MPSNPIVFIALMCFLLAGGAIGFSMLTSLGMMLGNVSTGKKKLKEYCFVLKNDLPGKNCGECGYDTCAECAEAMLFKDVACDQCPYCDVETMKELHATVKRYWFLVETSNIPLAERKKKKNKK